MLLCFFFLVRRRPPGATQSRSSAASDVYKRQHTYGYKKSSILAAFFNSVILLVAMGAIILESVKRFSEPHPIPGDVVMIVAGIGVVINAISVSYTHLRAHETPEQLVCRLLLEKKKAHPRASVASIQP